MDESREPQRFRRRDSADAPEDACTRRRLIVVLPLVMATAAIAFFVLEGLKGNAMYVKSVDKIVAEKGRFLGHQVRAEGNLVEGSVEHRDVPCEYRFTVSKNGVTVPVRYPRCGDFPDTLLAAPNADNQKEVTMEGELLADNSFVASKVLAKCPSKYKEAELTRRGVQRPHAPRPENAENAVAPTSL